MYRCADPHGENRIENKSYMTVIFDDTGIINIQMVTKGKNSNQTG